MTEAEKLQQQLDSMKDELTKSISAEAKAETEKQIAVLEAKLKGLEKISGLETKVAKLECDATKNQQALDGIIAKQKDIPLGGPQVKTFETALEEGLSAKKENLTKYKIGDGKGFAIEIDKKAVGNMSSSASLTGSYFVAPQVVPGVVPALYEDVHMRNILPVGSTNSNIIRYVRDNGGEGGPAMVAEGGTKPQIDRDLAIYDAPARKIATYFRVPEEMIEDIPYLSSFLTQIGMEEVMKVEDTQVLYGDGTGQNLTGLFTAATAFAAGSSVVDTPNEFDVIRAAKKQIRNLKLSGGLVGLISPTNWFEMRSKKDTTKNYLFLGGGNGLDLSMNIDGVQLIEHTAVAEGDFIVFQPRAAQIFDRAGTTVRFYDQDQDNAIKNLITIVVEKRIALPIYRTVGIVKGTFATSITDLAS